MRSSVSRVSAPTPSNTCGPRLLLKLRSVNYFMDISINLRTKILDKVLSPLQYGKQDYLAPYVVNISGRHQGLIYYGTEHSQDPNQTKFTDIETKFKNFLNIYSPAKVNFAIESSIPPEVLDRGDMIKKYKESGFLVYLSKKYGVDFFCPEPGNRIIPLLLSFSESAPEDIAAWMFLNSIAFDFRFNKSFSAQYLKDSVATISNLIPNASYTLFGSRLSQAIGKKLIPENSEELILGIQKLDFDSIEKLLSPFDSSTVFNIISSDFRNVRDRFIAREILSVLEKGMSVFAVFGTNHAIAQEPVFKYFFESRKNM